MSKLSYTANRNGQFCVRDIETDEWIPLPTRKEVCPRCGGRGSHDHPSFTGHIEEMAAEDPDFMESYMAGTYDVRCEECGGANVVDVPIEEQFNDVQRRAWEQYCELMSELAAESRMRERGIQF